MMTYGRVLVIALNKRSEKRMTVFTFFLAGVNRNLDEVRGRILGRKPLPSIREVFSEVQQEENRKRIMNGGLEIGSDSRPGMSAMVVKGAQQDKGDRRKKLW